MYDHEQTHSSARAHTARPYTLSTTRPVTHGQLPTGLYTPNYSPSTCAQQHRSHHMQTRHDMPVHTHTLLIRTNSVLCAASISSHATQYCMRWMVVEHVADQSSTSSGHAIGRDWTRSHNSVREDKARLGLRCIAAQCNCACSVSLFRQTSEYARSDRDWIDMNSADGWNC